MEITGKIIVALPEMQGTSKAGNPWHKREYVLETQESFPRKVHFDFFGDRADQYPLAVGDMITLSFDIESREYQGRWFTSIRGWKAEKYVAQPGAPAAGAPAPAAAAPQAVPASVPPTVAPADIQGGQADGDLPF